MKFKSKSALVGLLLVAVMFVGCTGGGSLATDEHKIHGVLNQYESAMKARDAERLAGLATYPLYMDGTYFATKEDAIAAFTLSFLFITEVHEFKVINRQITITEGPIEKVSSSLKK